jgi:drug/metabolite transporter (DMT)-like permease
MMRAVSHPPSPSTLSRLVAPGLALLAGTFWSFGGLTVRSAPDADAWQYLVWRSIGVFAAMELLSLLRGRGFLFPRFLSGGLLGHAGALCLVLAAVAFIYALKATTVANAMFLASITPLLSMIMARIVLGERLTPVTIAAIGLALAGLWVMVRGDMGHGHVAGDIAAMLSSVGFAGYSICVRLAPGRDFTPSLSGYAAVAFLLCAAVVLASGKPLAPPPRDIAMALLHGAVFIGLGTLCFNFASPSISAVGLVVLAQTETIFAPVWVWLVFGETPSLTTVLGGALILAGVVMTALAGASPASARKPVESV